MYIVFIILTVIVAIMLIGIVLIQKSKGGGLSSQFGGGNQVLGVRGTNSFLEKTTWTLAALILVLSVCTAYTIPTGTRQARANQETTNQPAAPAPAKNFSTGAEKAPATPAPAQQGN
ncbi:MAG: preprotein translocase subunit SecG [Muribaculaceae bacterium]